MKNIILLFLVFSSSLLHAQFSAYDAFDDNSNDWLIFKNDTFHSEIQHGKLDVTVKRDTDFIDAKGAKVDISKPFRAEINSSFDTGSVKSSSGICWGAADDLNYHVFYITASGKYGFKTYLNGKWTDVVPPTSSPSIHVKGTNWLRVNSIITADGSKKLSLCINELLVKQIDFIAPFGSFYGIYSNGIQHTYFDDFFVYQRGAQQEEFEPSDLSFSLLCKANQLHFKNSLGTWACCVENGCRVDEDSATIRFWFSDMRAGDYSVLAAPFQASADGDFFNAAQRDFIEYIKDTADPITPLREETPLKTSIGAEIQVVQLGEVYTADGLAGNMYIRRYYVKHAYGKESGIMFQFIVPENSPDIPLLDQLVKQVVGSLDFSK